MWLQEGSDLSLSFLEEKKSEWWIFDFASPFAAAQAFYHHHQKPEVEWNRGYLELQWQDPPPLAETHETMLGERWVDKNPPIHSRDYWYSYTVAKSRVVMDLLDKRGNVREAINAVLRSARDLSGRIKDTGTTDLVKAFKKQKVDLSEVREESKMADSLAQPYS